MTTLLIVLEFVFAVVITIAVLLQKSSSIGLGAYSGSNESLFGAKGPAGFLAKFTFIVGFLFVVNTLALGYSYNKEGKGSIAEEIKTKNLIPASKNLPTNATPTNSTPVAPKAPEAK